MSVQQSKSINPEICKFKSGLIYDAEGITLLGKYSDELAAHRAKKLWVGVLGSHFLLEKERDYNLGVTSSLEENYFVLSCSFTSACGRYAFWRLINHQAPEAQRKLGASFSNQLAGKSPDEDKDTWIPSALEQQLEANAQTSSLLERLRRLFQ